MKNGIVVKTAKNRVIILFEYKCKVYEKFSRIYFRINT